MVKPVGLPGCWTVFFRRGEVSAVATKKRKTFPRPFSTVERKHCEVQQFQGSWCPGKFGGEASTTGAWLAPFGSWCLFGVMKMTGRRCFAPIFCLRKKTSEPEYPFFQAGYFLGFLVGFGKGFTLEMLFQDAFFPSRFLLTPFAGERDRRDGPKPASLLIFEILVGGRFHSQIGQRNVHSGKIHYLKVDE